MIAFMAASTSRDEKPRLICCQSFLDLKYYVLCVHHDDEQSILSIVLPGADTVSGFASFALFNEIGTEQVHRGVKSFSCFFLR